MVISTKDVSIVSDFVKQFWKRIPKFLVLKVHFRIVIKFFEIFAFKLEIGFHGSLFRLTNQPIKLMVQGCEFS